MLSRLLDPCYYEDVDQLSLESLLENAVLREQGIALILVAIDRHVSSRLRSAAVDELIDIFRNFQVKDALQDLMLATRLSKDSDLDGAISLAGGVREGIEAGVFFQNVRLQSAAARKVLDAWDACATTWFVDEGVRNSALRWTVQAGVFRRFVEGVHRRSSRHAFAFDAESLAPPPEIIAIRRALLDWRSLLSPDMERDPEASRSRPVSSGTLNPRTTPIASLVPIVVASTYRVNGMRVDLPSRLAHCTPDTKVAILALAESVREKGGDLFLSHLFRNYDMQLQSYLDFASGKKAAFSPPPGGSLHEAGRAFDLDLEAVNMPLTSLWQLTGAAGLTPIIVTPDPRASEAWHFECRGSHQLVYEHYRAGKGRNFSAPYKAMAASAILAVGVRVEAFRGKEATAYLQSALVRLGQDIGNIDGQMGPKTQDGLIALGIHDLDGSRLRAAVDELLRTRYPREFSDTTPDESESLVPEFDRLVPEFDRVDPRPHLS
jgi:hypothetical protein